MRRTFFVVFVILVTLCLANGSYAASSQSDILIVLDNSGSMKKNDPEFLTGKAVKDFVQGLDKDSKIGIIIFSDKADVALPLTPRSDAEINNKVVSIIEKLNYNGKFTDIPAAIERAIYELKQNGRKDAEKLIVFMTDGVIDTGNVGRNAERAKWLKEDLMSEAMGSKIRIFSIAFTEAADFELIQSIAVKTEGGYYRALKGGDLSAVFSNIQQAIVPPQKKMVETPAVVNESKGLKDQTILVVVAVGIVIALGFVFLFLRGRKKESAGSCRSPEPGLPSAVASIDENIPPALIEDIGNVTGMASHSIVKKETTIGRADSAGAKGDKPALDITIPEDTISAFHATIEYQNNNFFLIDQRSTNGTSLNSQRIPSGEPQRLKSGDIISFDKFTFKFTLPISAERGGTVLRPAGGTVLRPKQEPVNAPGADMEKTAVKPDAAVRKPEEGKSEKPEMVDDKEGTLLKPMGRCPNHQSYDAKELCTICRQPFCKQCMTEKEGKQVCVACSKKKFGE